MEHIYKREEEFSAESKIPARSCQEKKKIWSKLLEEFRTECRKSFRKRRKKKNIINFVIYYIIVVVIINYFL